MTAPTAEVAAYLAALPPDQAALLSDLRRRILPLVPDVFECMSYAMPAWRKGKAGPVVVGISAFSRHCGIYPFSGSVVPLMAVETAGFKTSKSGVLFTPQQPLPDAILHRIIELRLAELAAGYGKAKPRT
jgi:uncharacterized protein YdhG (YjbR/CyaY superfamily)